MLIFLSLFLLLSLSISPVDSRKLSEVQYEFYPYYRLYKNGSVERFMGTEIVSPGFNPQNGVASKDVLIIPETGVSARLFIPKSTHKHHKLPLLVYFHGGAFCIESAFSPTYHNYLESLVAEANIIVVSVDYRRSPEYHLPIGYDDSWKALQWVFSHSKECGSEIWLTEYADFRRLFLAGDSAGGNIAHNVAMRAGNEEFGETLNFLGLALIHPHFWGNKRIGSEEEHPEMVIQKENIWRYACPSSPDFDDPRENPFAEGAPSLSGLNCSRVLVFVAGKDVLRDRGNLYYNTLAKSGWDGVVEIMETIGENHVFHLSNPTSEKAVIMLKNFAAFLNYPYLSFLSDMR